MCVHVCGWVGVRVCVPSHESSQLRLRLGLGRLGEIRVNLALTAGWRQVGAQSIPIISASLRRPIFRCLCMTRPFSGKQVSAIAPELFSQ